MPKFELKIVLIGARAHLYALHLCRMVLLSCFPLSPFLFVLVLPVIHYLAHGRISGRCYLDQVETFAFCERQGFRNGLDAKLISLFVYQPAFACPDPLIHPEFFVYATSPHLDFAARELQHRHG